ncbi:hypothetical protein TNCV_4482811 [Trichonephila clavipes]|nr:hypothetical protein TNCV_4482811 [Trichonephila clavipes]
MTHFLRSYVCKLARCYCSRIFWSSGIIIKIPKVRFQILTSHYKTHTGLTFDAPTHALSVSRGNENPNVGLKCKSFPLNSGIEVKVGITFKDGDRFNSCQVIYSQFGLAIHQNDQARRRFVEWAHNEIAVVPDFHKRILFSDEAHFWLNGYVSKQNCRIWSEANPQVYVETPLHPEKLNGWCALWAGGIFFQKR